MQNKRETNMLNLMLNLFYVFNHENNFIFKIKFSKIIFKSNKNKQKVFLLQIYNLIMELMMKSLKIFLKPHHTENC